MKQEIISFPTFQLRERKAFIYQRKHKLFVAGLYFFFCLECSVNVEQRDGESAWIKTQVETGVLDSIMVMQKDSYAWGFLWSPNFNLPHHQKTELSSGMVKKKSKRIVNLTFGNKPLHNVKTHALIEDLPWSSVTSHWIDRYEITVTNVHSSL